VSRGSLRGSAASLTPLLKSALATISRSGNSVAAPSREGFQGHGERADGAQLRRALAQLDKGDVLTAARSQAKEATAPHQRQPDK
jgi:hypothetical protein